MTQREETIKNPFTGKQLMFMPKPDLKMELARTVSDKRLTVEKLCNRFPSWNNDQIKEELSAHLN